MNDAELGRMTGGTTPNGIAEVQERVASLARTNGRPVFVTLAEQGIVGAFPDVAHVPAHPIRGDIDVDKRFRDRKSLRLPSAAGGLPKRCNSRWPPHLPVLHQLGTTGSAHVLLRSPNCSAFARNLERLRVNAAPWFSPWHGSP
ncbi:MAG: hypothetical protein U0744_20265 [Gemmataceae bacterium]